MRSTATAKEPLVGREHEGAALAGALARLEARRGGLLLLAGDAGVGKTRLAEEVMQTDGVLLLRGDAVEQAPPPYGPIVAALRAFLRIDPHGLEACGPLVRYLRVLLPELGGAAPGGDRATVFEAVRCAFRAVARRGPTVVFLDDLHWSDATTLDLLASLSADVADEPLLLLGAYRSDEIPRGHPLRRMRVELRRAGRLQELALDPLDAEATAALAARTLGAPPATSLVATMHDRTQGVPFFVEELCAALLAAGRVVQGPSGLELGAGGEIPIPDTVRDAILTRIRHLSPEAQRVLEVASVAGLRFDLALVAELAGATAIDEPVSLGVVVEVDPGAAAFCHTLSREAVYREVPWGRRRALHRRLAELLEERRGANGAGGRALVGGSRAGTGEAGAARHGPRSGSRPRVSRCAGVFAPRARPSSDDENDDRLPLQERIGRYSELCGELADAVAAWDEARRGAA